MKIITKTQKVKNIPKNWKAQYRTNTRLFDGTFSDDIYKKLKEEPDLTEQKAIEIIGNNWASNVCDECEKDVEVLVMLGDEPDYESNTVYICHDCLDKAKNLMVNS